MSVLDQFPQILPVTTHAATRAIQQAAAADGHGCPHVTHGVFKRGDIVGGIAMFRAPVVFWWMDSQRTGLRDSAQTWNFIENLARGANIREIIVPCSAASPYYPMLPACGFQAGPTMTLFTKPVSYADPQASPAHSRNGEDHVL